MLTDEQKAALDESTGYALLYLDDLHAAVERIVSEQVEAARAQGAREALMDAGDYLLPNDKVGPEFLTYLAVTKYGRSDFDHVIANGLINRAEAAERALVERVEAVLTEWEACSTPGQWSNALHPRTAVEEIRAALSEDYGPGCDCTELCSMGPTCPGAILANLPESGCVRAARAEGPEERRAEVAPLLERLPHDFMCATKDPIRPGRPCACVVADLRAALTRPDAEDPAPS